MAPNDGFFWERTANFLRATFWGQKVGDKNANVPYDRYHVLMLGYFLSFVHIISARMSLAIKLQPLLVKGLINGIVDY